MPDAAEKLLSMLSPHWPAPIVSTLRARWLARLKAMAPEAAFRKLYADALDVTTPAEGTTWPAAPRTSSPSATSTPTPRPPTSPGSASR